MRRRHVFIHLLSAGAVGIFVFCAAAVTPLAAQQTADGGVTASSAAEVGSPATVLPGPRLPPWVPSVEPVEARMQATGTSALAAEGGRHTIVFSTLALVLAVIIIVLLVR